MKNRIDMLREFMNAETAFLILNPVNVRYMSGFTGGEAELLISQDRAVLFTDFRYIEQAHNETKGYEIVKVTSDFYELIKNILLTGALKSLALEEDYINHKEYKYIEKSLAGFVLTDQNQEIERMRQVKDTNELLIMKKAAQIGDEAFAALLKYIKVGMSENHAKNYLEHTMKELGASGASFETIIASGRRSAMPHGTASEKIIEDGDIVTVDFGCVYQGYCSDMTRTFFIGDCEKRVETAELREIYEIVNSARAAAVGAARAGITGRALDAVARDYIRAHGYGDYFGHGLGHGVGLNIHEMPNANMRNEKPLPVGAVITIEPGIYVEGLGGVRIEDTVIIEKNGCEIITCTDRGWWSCR